MNQHYPELQFTECQRRAIEHLGEPLMIIGGPGSGKTRVLAERASWLIARGHASAFGTLVVTFGNRAARELMSRLQDRLPPDTVAKMHVKTISGFCLELLSTFGDLLGFDIGHKRLRVIPVVEAREVLTRVLYDAASAGFDGLSEHAQSLAKRLTLDVVADLISKAKHSGVAPEDYSVAPAESMERALACVYRRYQAELKRMNVIDFGDLLLQAIRLLDGHDEATAFAKAVFTNVLVDEHQDVSFVEWRILQHLFGERSLITVAGDPAQSIHAWRNAMGSQCFAKFQDQFATAERIVLNENHRSSRHIVAVSSCLIEQEARQGSGRSEGLPVVLMKANSEHEEVELIAVAIDALIRRNVVRFENCAVMCRTNAQVEQLEKALLQAKIPYRIVGHDSFFQSPDIRHVLAYLAISLDPGDDYAVRQVAHLHFSKSEIDVMRSDEPELRAEHIHTSKAGDDPRFAQRIVTFNILTVELAEMAESNANPTDAIDKVIALTRVELVDERATRRVALLKTLAEPFKSIRDFLIDVEAWSGEDPLSSTGCDQVAVMTLHQAKGLEFDASFLVGANEGVLPHYHASSALGLAEEKRLMYVGLTRGRELCIVTYARERQGQPSAASRFVKGWPTSSVVHIDRNSLLPFVENLPTPASQ